MQPPPSAVRSFMKRCLAISPFLLWLLLILLLTQGHIATAAEFVRTGALREGRDMAMAATLPDGRVLVTGGVGLDEQGIGIYLATSELFDPQTNTFKPTGAMTEGRDGNATLTLLANGKVLVTGGTGHDAGGQNIALASAEVYDPASGQFQRTANDMSHARFFHAATLLADGRVLVMGGWGTDERLESADIYDPATDRFTRTGDMTVERNSHTATTLSDGRVLVAAGLSTDAEILSSAEIYDPATGQFSVTGPLAKPRYMATASRLADGRVLVGGGMDNGEWRPIGEIYDPSTGLFSTTGALHWSRSDHAQSSMPDGRVLFTAGVTDEGPSRRAERYDPATGKFILVANKLLGRARAATAVLNDGRVLVAGGNRPWEPPLAFSEAYTPTPGPYADLVLGLTASVADIPAGADFHYLLSLQNSGTETATGVGIEAELPAEISVRQIRIAQSNLSGKWRCEQNGAALSCAPENGVLRANANPKIPRPAVAIRIDVTAPTAAPEWPLVTTALASTATSEDITANNEAGVVTGVAQTTARGIARKSGSPAKEGDPNARSHVSAIHGLISPR